MLKSVVIVKWARGYVAHVRFDNPKLDRDISSNYHDVVYYEVEKYIRRIK